MRAPAWLVLLAWAVACGKQGAPLRHAPQPRQATAPVAITQPAVQDPEPAEPAAVVEETDSDAAAETEP